MPLAVLHRVRGITGRSRNLGFGAFSRVTALGSQFVVLILLGKFMEKAAFGDFMTVFALTRVLSQGLGIGLATLLVYHISRNATVDREISLHRSVTLLSLAISGAVSLCMFFLAPQIAGLFSKPSLVQWLTLLAPFQFFSTLLTVSVGALDGRGRITHSITALELTPNIIRLVMLPMLLPFGFPTIGIAGVMTVSVLLPWIVQMVPLLRHPGAGFAKLTGWDLQYAGKLVLHSFAAMQMQGVDMIVVGWLFSSNQAADYAIASRIAALLPFFQQILMKSFMVKAGRALHDEDRPALQSAILANVRSTILLVGLTSAAALIVYPAFAHLVGDFGSSMPLMAALAVAPVMRAYFSANDPLMRIAGQTNASLTIMLLSCSFVILFPIALKDVIGIYALPLGMFASAVLLNPISGRYLHRRLHVRMMPAGLGWTMGLSFLSLLLCILSQHNLILWYRGVAALLGSLAFIFMANRRRGNLSVE